VLRSHELRPRGCAGRGPHPISEVIGIAPLPSEWWTLYPDLSASADTVFVKTHSPPEDDQPCIYVVRNGRLAILSYYHYLRAFFPGSDRNLIELILGAVGSRLVQSLRCLESRQPPINTPAALRGATRCASSANPADSAIS